MSPAAQQQETRNQKPETYLRSLSWLYAAVAAGRNWLYERGYKASVPGWVPLIGVGNLRVGGTGKTPHVAWVVEELLRQGQRPAILSRGYGRRTRGPRLAGPQDSAATVGDEPWQYYGWYASQNVPVAVAENRLLGLALLRQQRPDTTVVVLDDAYQHRRVRLTLNILLTEQARPFWRDYVLPAGRLRESRAGAARADVLVVTKCPPAPWLRRQDQATAWVQAHKYLRPEAEVLFSSYDYAPPRPLTPEAAPLAAPAPVGLLTGIAQPEPLREHLLEADFQVVEEFIFPDHHAFTPAELAAVAARLPAGLPLLTTEKDAARLADPALRVALAGRAVYTIPVRVAFAGDGAAWLARRVAAVFLPVDATAGPVGGSAF